MAGDMGWLDRVKGRDFSGWKVADSLRTVGRWLVGFSEGQILIHSLCGFDEICGFFGVAFYRTLSAWNFFASDPEEIADEECIAGWWFQICFISSLPGEDSQFD